MKKRNVFGWIALLLCLSLLFSSCSGLMNGKIAADSGSVQNEKGEVRWELDGNGLLKLSGGGTVPQVPVNKKDVKQVLVGEGFDTVGEGAFEGMTNLETVSLPTTMNTIEANAFQDCTGIAELELPESVKEVASTAFGGWEKTQKIVSEWYEGNAEHFEEWFAFARQFGEDAVDYLKENNIPEETKAKLSEWWSQWKDSEYWDEVKEAGKEVGSAAMEEGKTWFQYWKEFGMYLTDDDAEKSVPEGKPSWWEDADEFTDYLGKRIRDAGAEIPEKFRNYYAEHKDEIDSFVDKAGEVAKNIGEKVWDKLKDIFEKASE